MFNVYVYNSVKRRIPIVSLSSFCPRFKRKAINMRIIHVANGLSKYHTLIIIVRQKLLASRNDEIDRT